MRKRPFAGLVAGTMLLTTGAVDSAADQQDGQPTKLVKQARLPGITKAGEKYTFAEQEGNSDTWFLTVDVPTSWSDMADSHFVNPDTEEPYGVGLRATTDADAFSSSFDVPGVRVTAAAIDAGDSI